MRTQIVLMLLCCVLVWTLPACQSDDDDPSTSSGQADDDSTPIDDDTADDDATDDDTSVDDDTTDDDTSVDDDTVEPEPFNLVVMTYNILFDFPNPDYYGWRQRKVHQQDIVTRHDPDLIGLQEPLWWQVGDLIELLPQYTAINYQLQPDSTILYRTDRFVEIESGHYFLSPWPDIDLSIGFGNFLPRLVVWAKLYDQWAQRELFFVNTHFDNTAPFQENAAPLFLERTEPLAAELPTLIAGDFNSKPDREAYIILTEGVNGEGFELDNTFDIADEWYAIQTTGDPRVYDPAHRIDHIFYAGCEPTVSEWIVDMSQYGDPPRDPSDHFPMIAHVAIP